MPEPNPKPVRLRLFSDRHIFYSKKGQLTIQIAVWSTQKGLPFNPYFVVIGDGKVIPVIRKKITPFSIPTVRNFEEKRQTGYWYFYGLAINETYGTGWHLIQIDIRPIDGFTTVARKCRWMIEPAAPEVSLSIGHNEDGQLKFTIDVARRQLSSIMQQPLTVLSEIGTEIARKFQSRQITRIFDLLLVDPSTHLIPDVHIHDVPDTVTKAHVLNDFRWSQKLNTLIPFNFNQLAILTTKDIQSRMNTSEKKANHLLKSFREVHMVLDRSQQDILGLSSFIRAPHSGLDRVVATLNGQDVSDQVLISGLQGAFSTTTLPEGKYALLLTFFFKSGNRREILQEFTIDQTGPEINLIQPAFGSFLRDNEVTLEVAIQDKWSEVEVGSIKLFLDEKEEEAPSAFYDTGLSHRWLNLEEGTHTFQVEAADTLGHTSKSELWQFTVDRTPPKIQITSPSSPYFTSESSVTVEGYVKEPHFQSLSLNGEEVSLAEDQTFSKSVLLSSGLNNISVQATDKAGNSQQSEVIQVYGVSEDQAVASGKVYDQQKQPLAGIHVFEPRSEQHSWTNTRGEFVFTGLPEGKLNLQILTEEGDSHQKAIIGIQTSFGQITDIQDIYLLPIVMPALQEEVAEGKIFRNGDFSGFELFIPKDVQLEYPEGPSPITMTMVPTSQLPYEIPVAFPDCQAAVFGPSGLRVSDGSPMKVSLPNDLDLPKDERIILMAIDGATGGLSAAGVARVSEDASSIVSEEGHGLTHFSVVLPLPTGAQIEPYREDEEVVLDDAIKGGSKAQISLPGFRLLNRRFLPRLVYSSLAAAPTIHMTATFKGMREITTHSRVIDHVHVQREASIKRVEYFADYSLWLRGFRDHKGTEYFNQEYGDAQFQHVTYLPTQVETPILPVPESIWYGGTFGPQFQWVLDRLRQQEWTVKLYEINMRLAVTEKHAVWPESITGRYLFSDLDSGPFTIAGPVTPIGPEPQLGEEDTRSSYPRLPENMLLSYHMDPRMPDGSFYPTGLYSWLGNFEIKGRTYRQIQSSQVAQKGAFNYDAIRWMMENSEGKKREELEKLMGVLQKAHDLHRNGPIYASKYSYGDPLDYLMNQQSGQTVIHNLSKSPFGAGWKLEEQHELVPVGRNQVLAIGPEGKQVFTVANKIQKIAPAYLGKIAFSRDGSKLYATSFTGPEWIADRLGFSEGSFTTLLLKIVGSKAFVLRYPDKESFFKVIYKQLMHRELLDDELELWIGRPNFNFNYTRYGTWDPGIIAQFLYSDEYLRHNITKQYEFALDRQPVEEELEQHKESLVQWNYNQMIPAMDPQLHVEKLMVIATDLLFSLREEMKYRENHDWYIYMWSRAYDKNPTTNELNTMIGFIARYGQTRASDEQIRSGLHMWVTQRFWWGTLKGYSMYEELLGFPYYQNNGLRVFEKGEERDLGIVFPDAGTHIVKARYRCYRSVNRTDTPYYQPPSSIVRYPREKYFDGETKPNIKGLAEGKEGHLFVADANSHHIYLLAEKDKIDELTRWQTNYQLGYGDYMMAVIMGPINHGSWMYGGYTYYDETGTEIALPEPEAEWIAAYREYTRLESVQGGIYAQSGFSPDGNYKDVEDGKLKRFLIDTPGGLALDHQECLCFAETGNHRVRKIDFEMGELSTIAGNGESFGYDPTVRDASKTAIPEPIDVVISKRKEIYFLFHIGLGQQCIGKVDRAGFYTHVAGSPTTGTGTLDTGTDARFFKLTGGTSLTLSPTGELFVSLANQHRVMVITPDGYIDTVAGNGESGIPNDGGSALLASLGKPSSIACDTNGNLLINDPLNKSLRIVNLSSCEHLSDTYFNPPLGYFEAGLVRHKKGNWSKKYKDGSMVEFDREGKHSMTRDRNGNETKYLYEGNLLKSVQYPAGGKLEFSYDENGKLLDISDHVGRKTEVQIEAGRLKSVKHADEAQIQFSYDPDGRLLKLLQSNELEITYNYNSFGRLIAQSTNGQLTQIERPDDIAAGNLDQENQEALVAYQNLTSTISAEGNKTSYQLEHGRVAAYISAEGGTLHIHYTLHGLPKAVTRPSGSQVLFSYNDQGDRIHMEDTFTGSVIETVYNRLGKKIEETNHLGIKSMFEYDERGNSIGTKVLVGELSQELSRQMYDERGLLITRSKKGVVTTYSYDEQGNLIREQRGIRDTSLHRDTAGNILQENKDSIQRAFTYGPLNQILSVHEGDHRTSYKYDFNGNLTEILAPNDGVQSLQYDGRNRLAQIENPNGRIWQFEYDWEDRLIEVRYPEGKTLKKNWNGNTEMSEVYEEETSSFTFFQKNEQRSAFNSVGGFVNILDEAGRQISQSQVIDDQVFELEFQIDPIDRVMKLQSDGIDIVYQYAALGQLESISCQNLNIQLRYDDHGRLFEISRGNGWTSQINYDTSGLAHLALEQYDEETIISMEVSINAAGHTKAVSRETHASDFEYDVKGQLKKVVTASEERSYTYDSIGNRLSGPMGAYQYDQTGQLLLSCPEYDYRWDAQGRLLEKVAKNSTERHAFQYNAKGQLTGYNQFDVQAIPRIQAAYSYDAVGRRIKKEVTYRDEPERTGVRKWVYDGENMLFELNALGEITRQYISGAKPDSWLGFLQEAQPYYFLKDHLGSIRSIINDAGEVVATYEYDEFGQLLNGVQSFENAITYTGREWDEESGLYYYRMRHYDPALGRFLQPDPYLGSPKEPKSMINRYIYVHNNPLTYRDPSGLSPQDALSAIGDAALWVADMIWEILKFLLTPNGEPLQPVASGPGGTYRDSFDASRANNALTQGYWDAKEWIGEVIDQSIGNVLRELWGLVSDLFDWSTPDISLPTLAEVVGSDFSSPSSFGNDQNLVAQIGKTENRTFDRYLPPEGQIAFPIAASAEYSTSERLLYKFSQNQVPFYIMDNKSAFQHRKMVLIILAKAPITNVKLFKGATLVPELDPKRFTQEYFKDPDTGTINPGELPHYDYSYKHYYYFDIQLFKGHYTLSYTYYGQYKEMKFVTVFN